MKASDFQSSEINVEYKVKATSRLISMNIKSIEKNFLKILSMIYLLQNNSF